MMMMLMAVMMMLMVKGCRQKLWLFTWWGSGVEGGGGRGGSWCRTLTIKVCFILV